jgi:uncharacterized protein GlcG (DUF336 family)
LILATSALMLSAFASAQMSNLYGAPINAENAKEAAAQTGSVDVAIDKACSAALFKRPTRGFQDAIAGGG